MLFLSNSMVNLAFGVIKTPKRRFISLSITCLCVTKLLKRKWEIFSRFKVPKFVQSKVSVDQYLIMLRRFFASSANIEKFLSNTPAFRVNIISLH